MINNLDPSWAGVIALAGLLIFGIIMAVLITIQESRAKKPLHHSKV